MNNEFPLLVKLCAIARGLPVFSDASLQNLYSTTASPRLTLDENRLLRQALQHKTVSSLYAGLSITETLLSQPSMKKLKRLMSIEKASRSFLMQEWRSIDEACQRHGIPVMTIKGPAASLQLYGDSIIREYTDLDMIVNMQDKCGMAPIMKDLGYAIKPPLPDMDQNGESDHSPLPASGEQPLKPHRLWIYYRFIREPILPFHITFSKQTSPFRVEINNRVFREGSSENGMSLKQVFARSETVVQDGYAFATLGLADHAVFMLQHGAKHSWCLLHWVLDAAAILHHNDPELHREMALKIQSLQWERQLALIVIIVQKLFPIAVPEPFENLIAPYLQSMTTPARIALNQLQQADDSRSLSKVTNIMRFIFGYQLPLAQGCKEKIKILLQLCMIKPADAETIPLPLFLQPLYLLLGPFFIFSHRIKRLLARR